MLSKKVMTLSEYIKTLALVEDELVNRLDTVVVIQTNEDINNVWSVIKNEK